jgi:plasmid stabilization system protein ParE
VKPPIFRPAAAADVEEAYRWYEAQQAGLGDEFLAALRVVIESMTANPELFPVVHRQTRRALLRRFPYGLYYRIVNDQIVGRMYARSAGSSTVAIPKLMANQVLQTDRLTAPAELIVRRRITNRV